MLGLNEATVESSLKECLDLFENYQQNNSTNLENQPFEIGELLSSKNNVSPKYLAMDSNAHYLHYLLNFEPWTYDPDFLPDLETYLMWEIKPDLTKVKILKHAAKLNSNLIFMNTGFIRSIYFSEKNKEFAKAVSFIFDDLTSYYDATRPSRLEQMLNNKSLVITEEQKIRAKNCIDKIVKNHLTKYNHQPIYTPGIGREGVKKVLIVDQAYGDYSISKGCANDETFKEMLECAIKENPNADIIIKTHPDTIIGKKSGYYSDIQQTNNVYKMTEEINPISLIKYCDKIYVCSSQLGFEALMCEKEVHAFGVPFYSNWGLTVDRQKCERRQNTRTLEEMFYITYIMYIYYVNPKTQSRCEIEEAMDYLLEIRDEFFKNN